MLRVRDIMTTDVLTVSPELSLRDAMDLLSTRHVSGAPVVVGDTVLGVISTSDLLGFAASLPGVPTERPDRELDEWDASAVPTAEFTSDDEPPGAFFVDMWGDAGADVTARFANAAGPEWNALEEHTVAEAMTPEVRSVTPETPVEQAADLMRKAGVHRMLVVRDGKLVGIVTTKDISDAVADHMLTARTYVFPRGERFPTGRRVRQ